MFYFIPAWYNNWRPWYDATDVWYRGSSNRFDDTISQLRMFRYAEKETKLVVLNYMPNLRYILHRYDLLETPCFSLFDTIQDIQVTQQKRIDFKRLQWPSGVEFIYTPFLVVVRHHKRQLATVEFGEDGQLIWIHYTPENEEPKRYVFDDRGFVSSIVYFKDGQEYYQDYLNLSGQWQIREYLLSDDRHVEVAENAQSRFGQATYTSMEDVVREQFVRYVEENVQTEDVFVVASHRQHNELLAAVKGERKSVLSYYQQRFDMTDGASLEKDMGASDAVVIDSIKGQEILSQYTKKEVEHVPLFDTSLVLGKSQRLKELILHVVVDNLAQDDLDGLLADLFVMMRQNADIVLSFVSYDWNGERRESIHTYLKEVLAKETAPYLFFEGEEWERTMFEITEEDHAESRVHFTHLGSELAIQQEMEQARLVIDLQEEPHLYTQIAAISAGVPQINRTKTEFVGHMKNGYLLQQDGDLVKALDHYLAGLRQWNEALVYAVQKIDDYTSGRLVHRLVEKIQ